MIRGKSLLLVLLLAATYSVPAWAQLDDVTLSKRKKAGFFGKFKSSFAQITTSMGTGTFYKGKAAGDGYVSNTFVFYPRFRIAPFQSVRLYSALECEYTSPASVSGRRCDPSDIRLSYNHTSLYTDPWLKGRFYGYVGVYLPTSYSSINNNTVMNMRVSGSYYLRLLKKKQLELSYSFAIQKYAPTSRRRSSVISQTGISNVDGQMGSTGSGTGNNDNWLFINAFHVGYYFTNRLFLGVDLLTYNYVRYEVEGLAKDPDAPIGRADWTLGYIELSYQPHKSFLVGLGITSFQPALTADNKSLRFPFYDFISPENNYTKWYLSGTYIY